MSPLPGDESSSFHVLFVQARSGSEPAIELLLEKYRDYLLLIANKEMPVEIQGKVAPSDIVQETLLGAWQELDIFRGAVEEEFLGWLRRILLNKITDQTRKFTRTAKRQIGRELELDCSATRDPHTQAAPQQETPSSRAMLAEEIQNLEKALSRLSDFHRQLIQWRNYERLSFKEIAARLDCTPDTARKSWARAIELLRLPDEGK